MHVFMYSFGDFCERPDDSECHSLLLILKKFKCSTSHQQTKLKTLSLFCYRALLLMSYLINLCLITKQLSSSCDLYVWELKECFYYLQRAEHTGGILLPAASHTPLLLRFLENTRHKTNCLKTQRNQKWKLITTGRFHWNNTEASEISAKDSPTGQPGLMSNQKLSDISGIVSQGRQVQTMDGCILLRTHNKEFIYITFKNSGCTSAM